ncbi:NFAT activation molecule 1 [Clarias gariepinus]|uniref:NFAT activation molecule 1 n=1 Tax=Clarias gariepinus TaxID=13013 RepID=UPI00234D7BD6|nr:NFAT activation molecule 1 [Clarias gariepinus]
MFTTQFGVFSIFLWCCCNKSEAILTLKSRTSVALAGEKLIHQLEVTILANSSRTDIFCYQNSTGKQIWKHAFTENPSSNPLPIKLSPNIIMNNSSCSGEYYFQYQKEKVYWVVLVRDMGYQADTETLIISLAVIIIVLLSLSITGSVYIFKWYKNHPPFEGDKNEAKAEKRKRNTVATEEGDMSDSVYTTLDQTTVSVYDVLNVDEERRARTESQTSKKKAKPSTGEEGIFESVYENL